MIKESKYISNEDYHNFKNYISSSGMKLIYEKSVFHYLNQEVKEPTDAMIVGSATHTLILEPQNFDDEFLVIPKINKRTKAGKEEFAMYLEKAKKTNKQILSEDDYDLLQSLKTGVYDDKESARLIHWGKSKGIIEMSHFAEHQGVQMRIRPDIDIPEAEMLIDLKTIDVNTPKAFRYKMNALNWDLQAIMYCYVRDYYPANFRFIAVEKKHPYSSQVYAMDSETIERGKEKFFTVFKEYKNYIDTGLITKYRGGIQHDDTIFI